MLVLTQFVLRLSFGLAFSMGLTSSRQVTSGYFRNHAYVLLGLNVLATLVAFADRKCCSLQLRQYPSSARGSHEAQRLPTQLRQPSTQRNFCGASIH
jgi:hypothetical protein